MHVANKFSQTLLCCDQFPSPEWDPISTNAKKVIIGMLHVNPDKRSTVNQVLNSPWIMVWSAADASSYIHKNALLTTLTLTFRRC